jgi:hypothetical protein
VAKTTTNASNSPAAPSKALIAHAHSTDPSRRKEIRHARHHGTPPRWDIDSAELPPTRDR